MRSNVLIGGLAAVALAKSWLGFLVLGARLYPDAYLYGQGSLGLYPSPLGRLAGLGGEASVAGVNAAAAAACVVLVALIAQHAGYRPVFAAVLATLMPVGIWTIFAGMDAAGAAFLLGALYLRFRGLGRWALVAGVVAGLFHVAALVFLLGGVLVLGGRYRYHAALGVVGLSAVFLVTPYAGIVALDQPMIQAMAAGITVALLVASPFAILAYRLRGLRGVLAGAVWVAFVGTMVLAGLQVGDEMSVQLTRYGLPFGYVLTVVLAGRS